MDSTLEATSLSSEPDSGIHKLPAEILLIIFRLLFLKNRTRKWNLEWALMEACEPEKPVPLKFLDRRDSAYWSWKHNDMSSPNLFPFALAEVCQRWSALLGLIPAYWSRVVIHVDSPSTTPALVQSYLEYSQNERIHVWVTRRNKQGDSSRCENERVEMVMKYLRPHLHRCLTLTFNLRFRSSIVIAGAHLQGSFPVLRMLILKSKVTDSQESLSCNGDFLAPELSVLELDGKSFAGGQRVWMRQPTDGSSDRRVTLTRYAPSDTGMPSELTVDSIYASLKRCPNLTLFEIEDNVEFSSVEPEDTVCMGINHVILRGLQGTAASHFFRGFEVSARTTDIRRCELEGNWEAPLRGYTVSLSEIEDEMGLTKVLNSWQGVFLTVDYCSGFNESVIEAMIEHPPENMEQLEIYNGSGIPFSVNIFRDAVSAWEETLLSLAVHQPGNKPSEEDSAWFEERLDDFRWSSMMPPRNVHIPPADCTDVVDTYDLQHMFYGDQLD